jgi:hypothetical protein
MIRAARLDVDFYQEAERDTSLTTEALLVVVIVSAIGGLGSFLGSMIRGRFGNALLSLVLAVVTGIAVYYIWGYITWFVGTRLFGGTAEVGGVLRTLGYAYTPSLLAFLSFIPGIGWVFALVGFVLTLIAALLAIKEALGLEWIEAGITVIIGWVIMLLVRLILGLFGINVGLGNILPPLRRFG